MTSGWMIELLWLCSHYVDWCSCYTFFCQYHLFWHQTFTCVLRTGRKCVASRGNNCGISCTFLLPCFCLSPFLYNSFISPLSFYSFLNFPIPKQKLVLCRVVERPSPPVPCEQWSAGGAVQPFALSRSCGAVSSLENLKELCTCRISCLEYLWSQRYMKQMVLNAKICSELDDKKMGIKWVF